MKISASFLSIKNNLRENINILSKTSIDYMHLDIMDGKFVPNKTWSYYQIKGLLRNIDKPKDIHLMVKNVKRYIKRFRKLNPLFITFHLEAVDNIFEVIKLLKEYNIKAGISIKPSTSIKDLLPYLSYIDLVLVMSVEPGQGGQEFINSTLDKINELDKLRKENNYNYLIEVDGGINDQNIKLLDSADITVVGSFITSSDNYQKQIDKLF